MEGSTSWGLARFSSWTVIVFIYINDLSVIAADKSIPVLFADDTSFMVL